MNRLPPVGPSWSTWARQVSDYIQRAMPRLVWKRGGETAAENGIILWDEIEIKPVVSHTGEFHALMMADGDLADRIRKNEVLLWLSM